MLKIPLLVLLVSLSINLFAQGNGGKEFTPIKLPDNFSPDPSLTKKLAENIPLLDNYFGIKFSSEVMGIASNGLILAVEAMKIRTELKKEDLSSQQRQGLEEKLLQYKDAEKQMQDFNLDRPGFMAKLLKKTAQIITDKVKKRLENFDLSHEAFIAFSENYYQMEEEAKILKKSFNEEIDTERRKALRIKFSELTETREVAAAHIAIAKYYMDNQGLWHYQLNLLKDAQLKIVEGEEHLKSFQDIKNLSPALQDRYKEFLTAHNDFKKLIPTEYHPQGKNIPDAETVFQKKKTIFFQNFYATLLARQKNLLQKELSK